MSKTLDSIVRVPCRLEQNFTGFSADFGASAIKFAYRSKEDADESTSGDGEYGRLRLVMFPRRELSQALEYVQKRSVITRDGGSSERPTVHTTGVGCTQHGKLIADTFNVRLQQLTEFDCVAKAFAYLSAHLPRDEFLEPITNDEGCEQMVRAMKNVASISAQQNVNCFLPPGVDVNQIESVLIRPSSTAAAAGVALCDAEPDMFPCLVVIGGSAFAFMKVEKDGSFNIVSMSSNAGRSFVGLGCLLTECETFEELIELAANGTERNVSEYTSDVNYASNAVDNDDSTYVAMANFLQETPVLLFSFGKAVGSKLGEFKREDLARTVLSCIVQNLVQCAQLVSKCHGIRRVFFTGGFCSSPLVRSVITSEYSARNMFSFLQGQTVASTFDFVKFGEYLGVLGCVIADMERSADV